MDRGEEGGTEIRFVDLCAGLGGFHHALDLAQRHSKVLPRRWTFKCVMAAELDPELRELYIKNFPEMQQVYAELFPEARIRAVSGMEDLYEDGRLQRVHGDVRTLLNEGDDVLRAWPDAHHEHDYIVPEHDLLCAGFPCQPFSKSGAQKGFEDLNGTVFRMLAVILKYRRPRFVLLENVGNFERHDSGNTWTRVHEVLTREFGYSVRYTRHVGGSDGGQGLLSPHHQGMPHHRERFFVVAQRAPFHPERYPFPLSYRTAQNPARELEQREAEAECRLRQIITGGADHATMSELVAAQISPERVRCITHWGALLERIGKAEREGAPFLPLPSFPIWGFEIDPWNHYPAETNPADLLGDPAELSKARCRLIDRMAAQEWWRGDFAPRGSRSYLQDRELDAVAIGRWVHTWPRYASSRAGWPDWKRRFIEQNRDWAAKLWTYLDPGWLRGWLDDLYQLPASHQKLEWNCKGAELDIWRHILQFRPSGLRVKRLRHVPALVAMSTTQIPIVPRLKEGEPAPGAAADARGRHLLPSEALQLQGFPPGWRAPSNREQAFHAFGNAVHAWLVRDIMLSWLFEMDGPYDASGRPVSQLPLFSPPSTDHQTEAQEVGRVQGQWPHVTPDAASTGAQP